MKKLHFFPLLFLMIFALSSKVFASVPENKEVFVIVEQMPEFPGGWTEMNRFIHNNVRYPVWGSSYIRRGRVVLQFTVLKSGEITDIEVIRGFEDWHNREAVRIVESMPKWIPGKQQGKKVNSRFILPMLLGFREDSPLDVVSLPRFPGGIDALESFLAEHSLILVGFPELYIPGTISCILTINESGEISKINVRIGHSNIDLTKEQEQKIKNAIKSMPDWIPAKRRNGQGFTTTQSFHIRLEEQEKTPSLSTDNVRRIVDTPPQLPGGTLLYLIRNLIYPVIAGENPNVRVVVQFVVKKTGEVTDIQIVHHNAEGGFLESRFREEAIRVIESMPLWIPGKHNGEKVNVLFTLPINFRLR